MLAWFRHKRDYDSQAHDPEEGDNALYWRLIKPQESWQWWSFLEATRDGMSGNWSFLPFGGCWAEQPAWLIHDLTLIGEYHRMIEEQLEDSLPQ